MAYKPGHSAHTILARLNRGPCHAGHLFHALGYPDPVPQTVRKAFWHRMDAMKADGLVFQGADKVFELLPAGEALLEQLNAEHAEPNTGAPTVRIFTRQSEGARA